MIKQLTILEASKLLNKAGFKIPTIEDTTISNENQNPFQEKTPKEEVNFNQEEKEVLEALLPKNSISDYTPLEWDNPGEMFVFFERASGGKRTLYKWQAETLAFLGKTYAKEDPLRFYLQACNGSGKDAYIIALFAIWFCSCKIRSRFIGTSSSYIQLEGQTEAYIKNYATLVNTVLQEPFFIIKKQHVVCKRTGSEIVLFTTNEPGRAEGWHPFPDYDKAEMVICINEAKTVSDEIFSHLKKCTGYNYWIEVSSPGDTTGHFYNECRRAHLWEDGYDGSKFKRKVTALECPHISRKEIKDAVEEHGENNPWVRATYFAEFTSLDSEVVITGELLNKLLENLPERIESCSELPTRVGIDIGGVNDEDTIYACKGNYLWRSRAFRQPDTVIKTEEIHNTLIGWGLTPELIKDNLFIDDGNVGKAIVDNLIHKGWYPARVLNQGVPYNIKIYGNRGAELWFNFRRLVEKFLFWLPYNISFTDNKLYSQLIGRYYKQSTQNNKILLEPKKEARGNGHGSPDRADALILANSNIRYTDIETFLEKKKSEGIKKGISREEFLRQYDDITFGNNAKKQERHLIKGNSLANLFAMKGF